jgi:hypothetical protein
MLIRLTPEQIADKWDVIKNSIQQPGTVDKGEPSYILKNLYAGTLHCWILYSDNAVKAVATTAFTTDMSGIKELLIYTLYICNVITQDEWKDAAALLGKWAKDNSCKNITSFVSDPDIFKLIEQLPFRKEIFITIPVGG